MCDYVLFVQLIPDSKKSSREDTSGAWNCRQLQLVVVEDVQIIQTPLEDVLVCCSGIGNVHHDLSTFHVMLTGRDGHSQRLML